MIKYVLMSIAAILVILGIYTYSNQPAEKSNSTPPVSEKKKEVTKIEKVSVVTEEVKKKKSSEKNIMVKSPKVVSQEPTQEMEEEEEIGKGLTLESIENADVSDEEKRRMQDNMLYYQSIHAKPSEPLSDEEILIIIEKDLKLDY